MRREKKEEQDIQSNKQIHVHVHVAQNVSNYSSINILKNNNDKQKHTQPQSSC